MEINTLPQRNELKPKNFVKMLSSDEELRLSRRWRLDGDKQALHDLVLSHRALVVGMATKYRGYGFDIDELIQEGLVGLLKSAQRFEPERGFRFSAYAKWWVRASILDFVLAHWSIVHMGRAPERKKLFFNLNRLRLLIDPTATGPLSDTTKSQIAKSLGIDSRHVKDMEIFLYNRDKSLQAPINNNQETEVTLQDVIPSDAPSPEDTVLDARHRSQELRWLRHALETLTERERTIIEKRKLAEKPLGFKAIGSLFGISGERVRQIEKNALSKLTGLAEEFSKNIKFPGPEPTEMG